MQIKHNIDCFQACLFYYNPVCVNLVNHLNTWLHLATMG